MALLGYYPMVWAEDDQLRHVEQKSVNTHKSQGVDHRDTLDRTRQGRAGERGPWEFQPTTVDMTRLQHSDAMNRREDSGDKGLE